MDSQYLCTAASRANRIAGFSRSSGALSLIVALSCLLPIGWARAAEPDTRSPDSSIEYLPVVSPREQRVLTVLNREVEFDFQETPLVEFVDELDGRCGVAVKLDRRGIGDAGVASDTPINCRLRGTSLRVALKQSLTEIGLHYFLKDGAVVISSKDVAESEDNLSIRVYSIGDIDANNYTGLINCITETVSKNSWDENGGPGKIEPATGSKCLIIAQTDEVHAKILDLLRALRTAHKLWPRDTRRGEMGSAVGQGMM